MRWIPSFLAGVLLGGGACYGLLQQRAVARQGPAAPPTVLLHRMSLRPDRLQLFDEWVRFEHAHHEETVETLRREGMHVEAIFRDRERDPGTIFWLEVRAKEGAPVETSPLPIDTVYERFMSETLVPGSGRTMGAEYVLIAPGVQAAMDKAKAQR